MARVTVEDCVTRIPNRFELVVVSAHRARALASGAALEVERDRDKNPVVALREISEDRLDIPNLKESVVRSLQKRIEPDEPEEEVVDLMYEEQRQIWTGDDEDEQPNRTDAMQDAEELFQASSKDSAKGSDVDLDNMMTAMGVSFEDVGTKD